MACRFPVVAFEAGGVPDRIRHGVTGLLAPRRDVAALRGAIEVLLQNPARRVEMGGNGRKIALQKYPLALQARRYSELYKSLR